MPSPKDLHEAKYRLFINKWESVGLQHYDDAKAFIECSNDMNDIYQNIDKYNLNKNHKMLIAFVDIIADILNNIKTTTNSNRTVFQKVQN